jgi:protein TonB
LGKFFFAHGGGNGTRPSYAENPKPIYPQEAKEKGFEGEVVLRVEVLANGRVGQIEIKRSSSYELLDRSALTAVKQWRFTPARKGDVVIPLWVNIPVKFQLQ